MNNSSNNWQLLSQQEGDDLKIFKVYFDHYLNLRNETRLRATRLMANDSVNVVTLTRDQKIILVNQYRFGTQTETLELPGGFVDAGEDHLMAAKRELLEETGYSGTQWKYLGFVDSNPVFMNSKIHHYLLEDATLTKSPKLDEGENVEVISHTLNELKKLLANNQITHPHTTSGLAMVFNIYGGVNF